MTVDPDLQRADRGAADGNRRASRGPHRADIRRNGTLKKILAYTAKIGISLALVGYLVWDAMNRGESAFTDPDGNFVPAKLMEVVHYAAAHWWWLAAAWVSCAAAVTLTLVRWHYLVRSLDVPVKLSHTLRIGLVGYLFNLAPLGIVGGDMLKAWLLARDQHGHRPEAVASVVVDRVVGLYLLFVVASTAIVLTGFRSNPAPFVQWTCKITLVVTAVATLLVISALMPDFSHGKTTRWIAGIPRVGPPLLRLVDAVQMFRQRKRALGVASLISIGVHSLFSLGVFLIAKGLYPDFPGLAAHFVLSPLSAATGVVPLAVGPFELMLNFLYVYAPTIGGGTMALGQGLVVAFGYRIATILIATVGACYYLASRKEVAEAIHEAEEEIEHEPDHAGSTNP